MTPDEFEALLEGQGESPALEFKAAMPWNVLTLAKDILAMANVQDGGRIVIGVEDGTWTRQGVDASQRDSYVIDVMRDQLAPYSDPHVELDCTAVKDRAGMEFIVIEVHPFREVPVICRKSSADLQAGAVYYRSRSGRPGSARVSSSFDMRDILERAVVKMMQRKGEIGYRIKPGIQEQLDDELGGL